MFLYIYKDKTITQHNLTSFPFLYLTLHYLTPFIFYL